MGDNPHPPVIGDERVDPNDILRMVNLDFGPAVVGVFEWFWTIADLIVVGKNENPEIF